MTDSGGGSETQTPQRPIAAVPIDHPHWSFDIPLWLTPWKYYLFFVCAWAAIALSKIMMIALCGLAVAELVRRGVVRHQLSRSLGPDDASSELQDRTARFVCYGKPRELAALVDAKGAFRDPYIAGQPARGFPLVLFALVVWPIGQLGQQIALGYRLPVWVQVPAFLVVFMGYAFLRLHTVYHRVSPGLLEVLRVDTWSGRMERTLAVSLRNMRVVCRFDRMKLLIMSRDGTGGVTHEVDLASVAEPHALAKAVFEAAMCEYPAQPLPEDALLG
jgi:hypothetical protein